MRGPRGSRPLEPGSPEPWQGQVEAGSGLDGPAADGLVARSLEVEVAPLGRRRRLPDRAIVTAILAFAFVALAVVKPWEGSVPGDPASVSGVDPASSPTPTAPAVTTAELEPFDVPTWEVLATVMPSRDGWGLRVVTDAVAPEAAGSGEGPPGDPAVAGSDVSLGDGRSVVERWYQARDPGTGPPGRLERRAGVRGVVAVPSTGAPVRLIALTSPAAEAPLDVRLWRVTYGALERLDGARPVGDIGSGDWYFVPPTVGGTSLPAWPAGYYRIDVLTATEIVRFGVSVDEGPGTPVGWPVPEPAPSGSRAQDRVDAPEPGDRGPDRQPVRPEPFMVVGSEVAGLGVRIGPALGERSSWLAAVTGEGPDELPRLATLRLPEVSGFGLRFPDGATEPRLRAIDLIGPARPREATRQGLHAGGRGGSAWAVVDAPDGRAWAPGVYRLEARWRDVDGTARRASYHVDLLAGRVTSTPTLLSATRAWARHGGRSGVVAGSVEPFRLPPSDFAIRLAAQAPVATPTEAAGLDPGCLIGEGFAGTRRPIGVVTDLADEVTGLDVRVIGAYARSRPVDVRSALGPVRGLAVFSPDAPRGWGSGRYAVTVGTTEGSLTYGFCID
jgi:hypothetical protein